MDSLMPFLIPLQQWTKGTEHLLSIRFHVQRGNRNKLGSVSALKMLTQSDRDLIRLSSSLSWETITIALEETGVSASPDEEGLSSSKMHRHFYTWSSSRVKPAVLFFWKLLSLRECLSALLVGLICVYILQRVKLRLWCTEFPSVVLQVSYGRTEYMRTSPSVCWHGAHTSSALTWCAPSKRVNQWTIGLLYNLLKK